MQTPNEKQDKTTAEISPIRTLRLDISKAARQGGNFLSEKIKPKNIYFQREEKNSPIKIISIIISAVILIIAAYYFSPLLHAPKNNNDQTANQQIPIPILASEEQIILNGDKSSDLKNQITETMAKLDIGEGDTAYMPIKRQAENLTHYATFHEFAGLTGINLTALVAYNTEGRFFLGAVKMDGLPHPILIVKIKDGAYENILPGLKKWEETILNDFRFLITGGQTNAGALFSDKLIKNQNARIAKNAEETFFLYSIFNKKYIIMTDNEKTFEKILKDLILFGTR